MFRNTDRHLAEIWNLWGLSVPPACAFMAMFYAVEVVYLTPFRYYVSSQLPSQKVHKDSECNAEL
jgi:hypothetical protein